MGPQKEGKEAEALEVAIPPVGREGRLGALMQPLLFGAFCTAFLIETPIALNLSANHQRQKAFRRQVERPFLTTVVLPPEADVPSHLTQRVFPDVLSTWIDVQQVASVDAIWDWIEQVVVRVMLNPNAMPLRHATLLANPGAVIDIENRFMKDNDDKFTRRLFRL
eukprot:Polyplicarium_translucidae@DN5190_c0_g1_i1.p1